MGRIIGLIALLIVGGIGGYVYVKQAQTLSELGRTPNTMIDLTVVRNDLIAIANAEHRFSAINGKYASLEELRAYGDIHIPSRDTYSYSSEATEGNFTIIATYSGPDRNAPKRISITETMALKTE